MHFEFKIEVDKIEECIIILRNYKSMILIDNKSRGVFGNFHNGSLIIVGTDYKSKVRYKKSKMADDSFKVDQIDFKFGTWSVSRTGWLWIWSDWKKSKNLFPIWLTNV